MAFFRKPVLTQPELQEVNEETGANVLHSDGLTKKQLLRVIKRANKDKSPPKK